MHNNKDKNAYSITTMHRNHQKSTNQPHFSHWARATTTIINLSLFLKPAMDKLGSQFLIIGRKCVYQIILFALDNLYECGKFTVSKQTLHKSKYILVLVLQFIVTKELITFANAKKHKYS